MTASTFPAGWGWVPGFATHIAPPPRKIHYDAIAEALRGSSDLMAIPTSALVRDICQRFGCCRATAYRALRKARQA